VLPHLPLPFGRGRGDVLKGFHGIVVADGYSAYGCVGRRAVFAMGRALSSRPVGRTCDVSCEALEGIGKLYKIDARSRQAEGPDRIARIGELRSTESAPIVKNLRDWLLARKALPRSCSAERSATRLAGTGETSCRSTDPDRQQPHRTGDARRGGGSQERLLLVVGVAD
jgi:hypothetical protein